MKLELTEIEVKAERKRSSSRRRKLTITFCFFYLSSSSEIQWHDTDCLLEKHKRKGNIKRRCERQRRREE